MADSGKLLLLFTQVCLWLCFIKKQNQLTKPGERGKTGPYSPSKSVHDRYIRNLNLVCFSCVIHQRITNYSDDGDLDTIHTANVSSVWLHLNFILLFNA